MKNRKTRNRRKMAIRTITKLIAEKRRQEERAISAAEQIDESWTITKLIAEKRRQEEDELSAA